MAPSPVPTPEAASPLAIGVLSWGDTGGPVQELAVLADGRVIDTNATSADGILEYRRLSEAGVAWLEDQLQASGLFTQDRTLKPVLHAGATAYLPGAGDAIQLAVGDKLITVRRNIFPPTLYDSTPDLDRFEQLLAVLEFLPQSVAAALWADLTPMPYIAATDSLCVAISYGPLDSSARPATDWTDVTWPMTLLPKTWGDPIADWPDARCAPIDFAVARQVEVAGADARQPGPLLEAGAASVHFDFDWADQTATVSLWLTPIPPG